MTRRGVIRCGVAAVLFGASAPAAARLAGGMSAFSLAGLLYLGAALAVVPFAVRNLPSAPAAAVASLLPSCSAARSARC